MGLPFVDCHGPTAARLHRPGLSAILSGGVATISGAGPTGSDRREGDSVATYNVVVRNGVPYCPQCGQQVTYRRAQCRACGFRYARGGGLVGGLVKLVCLAVLGLFVLGLVGPMLSGRRPADPAVPDPAVAIVTGPAPARVAGQAPGPIAVPAGDVRFGLPEEKRFEINNAIWQAGMSAHDEAERLYPSAKLDKVTSEDVDAGRQLEAARHALYEGRKSVALAMVAKRYGIGGDVLTQIDEEGAQKKWKVSPSPALFDPTEANRAVLAGKLGVDPTKADETELRAIEERRRSHRTPQSEAGGAAGRISRDGPVRTGDDSSSRPGSRTGCALESRPAIAGDVVGRSSLHCFRG